MSVVECAAQFRIHVRCSNCRKDSTRLLRVPVSEDAPCDIEELMESAFLREQKFVCQQCESIIGTIVAVTIPVEMAA